MPIGRHLIKTLLIACLMIAALFVSGCGEAALPPEPTPTPEPVVVSMEVVDLNSDDFGDMPSPTATPEPTPTPLPFSHFAPTVSMTYEELVGSLDDMSQKGKELLKTDSRTRRRIISSSISSGRWFWSTNASTTEQS